MCDKRGSLLECAERRTRVRGCLQPGSQVPIIEGGEWDWGRPGECVCARLCVGAEEQECGGVR